MQTPEIIVWSSCYDIPIRGLKGGGASKKWRWFRRLRPRRQRKRKRVDPYVVFSVSHACVALLFFNCIVFFCKKTCVSNVGFFLLFVIKFDCNFDFVFYFFFLDGSEVPVVSPVAAPAPH